jgi:hypothetical protein
MFIPRLDADILPKTAVSPELLSIVLLELLSTPGALLAGPPPQLFEFIQAVLVAVEFQVKVDCA